MVTTVPASPPAQGAIPPVLLNVCFALGVINLMYFPTAYLMDLWMYRADGLGVPTDFVNVWAAGRLVLDGHPALAYVVRPDQAACRRRSFMPRCTKSSCQAP
jgi:hypothetical protein